MIVLAIVLASVDILISVLLVGFVVFQEGNDKGLGVIGGGADTFFGKEKGRSLDNKLKKFTTALAIAFAIITVVLFRVIDSGL
ncbi:MAG: preprotein translocase subunit SecG [Clostridiaceae bacterium]|nr:preprotein translocase subunit SecG [Clostridiaceae bacterium]